MRPNDPALTDVSEQLALALDRDVTQKCRPGSPDTKLRVIWNDSEPCPSKRLYTLPQWVEQLSASAAPATGTSSIALE
jgi:hypothetical protein